MRILVTGGLGLIGGAIAQALADEAHQVVVVDDGRAGIEAPYPDAREIYTCAVEDMHVTGRMDAVIHCAGPVGPVGILGRDVLAEMLSATSAALAIAERFSCPSIVMSSSEVYGTVNPSGSLVVPDDWSARTEYAVGKIATEQLARRHHAVTSLPTCIIRPWNITGPRQSAASGFVFPRMAQQVAAGQPVTVYIPGDQRRAFMAVHDFAALVVGLLESGDHFDACPVDAANPDNAVSMMELAGMFGDYVVVDPQDEHGPDFREAAAGSKLPPAEPALRGWTPVARMVELARDAAQVAAPC